MPKTSAKPAAKPAAKAKTPAPATPARRPAAKPEPRPAAKAETAKKAAPAPVKAAKPPTPPPAKAKAEPKLAPKADTKAKAPAKTAKLEPVAKAKAAPKVEAKAPAAKAAPKVDAKAKPEPKKPEPKAKEAKPAKAEAKPAVAKVAAKAAPVAPPPKPRPLVAPVTTKTAPIITRPTKLVTSGNGARPIAAPRPAPKPLAAPKPVTAAPEVVGEAQPVPAFKSKSSTAPSAKNLVLVGAIAGAFGVKGELRLRAFTAEKKGVIAYGPLYSQDGKVLLRPTTWREMKDGVAVVAPEVKSKEAADKLRNTRLYVPRANLPATADDEFYIVDLLGCRAEALDGTVLGEITAVWNFGAGDILEYRPPNGGPNERVTFTKESAPYVDLAGKRVVLDPPPPEPPANGK